MGLPELIEVMALKGIVRERVEELADSGWIAVVWTLQEWMRASEAQIPRINYHVELLQEFFRAAGEDTRRWDSKRVIESLESMIWQTRGSLDMEGEVGNRLKAIPEFYETVLKQLNKFNQNMSSEDLTKLLDAADSCFDIMTQLEYIDLA
jgi:hypothetical protein